MRTSFRAIAFLAGILTACTPFARAQEMQAGNWFHLSSPEMAVTFTTEESKTTANGDNTFWFHGAGFEGASTLFRNLGAAAEVTFEEAGNVTPAVNIGKIGLMAGPRYTFRVKFKREGRVFVESLFGLTHAHGAAFPTSTGVASSATSFSFQLGGGWDLPVTKSVAVRLVEVNYVHSSLPNDAGNAQDHLQLAFGVAYHF